MQSKKLYKPALHIETPFSDNYVFTTFDLGMATLLNVIDSPNFKAGCSSRRGRYSV